MRRHELRKWLQVRADRFGKIRTWQRFAREVRLVQPDLLRALPQYSDSILVAGCQRSGTTAVSRLLTETVGMGNFWSRSDEELDAALVLSGLENADPSQRYCFQTTYLNERYTEYKKHQPNFKLIWILRRPESVVFSMLHNWDQYALDELYTACGSYWLDRQSEHCPVSNRPDALQKACACFNAKLDQLDELASYLPDTQLMILDYDQLVNNKEQLLPTLYTFVGLDYEVEYADKIRSTSIGKHEAISGPDRQRIEKLCSTRYRKTLKDYTNV